MSEQGIDHWLEHGVRGKRKRVPEKPGRWGALAARGEGLPFAFALAMCVGAMVYLSVPFEPDLWLVSAVGGANIALGPVVLSGRVDGVIRVLAILALGVGIGFAAGKGRTLKVDAPAISALIGPVMLEGWITEVEPGRKGVR